MHLILVLQVRSAYRTLAAKHHPDRQAASEVETTEEEFKRVRMRNPAILGYQVRCLTEFFSRKALLVFFVIDFGMYLLKGV